MTTSKIRVAIQGDIGVITLNDPATLNAASGQVAAKLSEAFSDLASKVRCVVLTGEGRGFCSGANLSGRTENPTPLAERDAGAALESTYHPFISSLRDYPLPIVTAVNGVAAGIGCSLALMGDLIVAAESAYFLQAFRRIGLVPDGGSTYLLPRLIGKARAMEMALLGDKLPAPTALQWGLVNRCVPDDQLMATALELAGQLASGPKSLGAIRRLVWDSLDAAWDEQLHAERVAQRDAGRTEDSIEGVRAFLEKRPAQFKGR